MWEFVHMQTLGNEIKRPRILCDALKSVIILVQLLFAKAGVKWPLLSGSSAWLLFMAEVDTPKTD